MRRLLAVIGVLLIMFAVYEFWQLRSRPLAVVDVGGVQAEVYPQGCLLDVVSGGGVTVRLSNGSVYHVSGRGVVPFRIGRGTIYFVFDSRGEFLSLSVAGNASVASIQSTEEFNRAVLTYTLAPFVAGLMFTLGSLAVSKEVRVRKG